MENGLITKGARLVIPSTLRSKVLEQIHEGHLGIEKCMLKARDSVFWPGISDDIRETGEMWNLSSKFQGSQTHWKCVMCLLMHGIH